MTDADLIYNYAKLYNQYNVKAILVRENWDDKDCDAKYAHYMQEFIRIKDIFKKKNLSDDKIKAAFNGFKKERIKSIYTYILKKFISILERRKGELTPEKKNVIMSRLDRLQDLEDVNFEYLYEIRKLEEEEF